MGSADKAVQSSERNTRLVAQRSLATACDVKVAPIPIREYNMPVGCNYLNVPRSNMSAQSNLATAAQRTKVLPAGCH